MNLRPLGYEFNISFLLVLSVQRSQQLSKDWYGLFRVVLNSHVRNLFAIATRIPAAIAPFTSIHLLPQHCSLQPRPSTLLTRTWDSGAESGSDRRQKTRTTNRPHRGKKGGARRVAPRIQLGKGGGVTTDFIFVDDRPFVSSGIGDLAPAHCSKTPRFDTGSDDSARHSPSAPGLLVG